VAIRTINISEGDKKIAAVGSKATKDDLRALLEEEYDVLNNRE
jgi:hypothetical protein